MVERREGLSAVNPGEVVPAIAEVLIVQWAASVAAYGYFLRDLNVGERFVFVLIAILGFATMTVAGSVSHGLLWTALALTSSWIFITRKKGLPRVYDHEEVKVIPTEPD